jgi:ethanolamine utilization protein EutA
VQTHTHDHGHDHGHFHDHDHDGFHDHHGDELSAEDLAAIEEGVWRLENVELTTVGVDIGSSTSHLMFARVHLQRIGDGLSSRFVVVNREVLWRSPILLTPYRADMTIDAERLGSFIHEAYHNAGLSRSDVDSGAIILTGEALKRRNARAIADLFASESGKFVCASAGHHMEALMAGHGSGAVALSRRQSQTILNVDVGGGTSKFALIQNGEVLGTAAVAVGGRLVVRGEDGTIVRLEDPALQAADGAGLKLALGEQLSQVDADRLIGAWTDVLVGMIHRASGDGRENGGAGKLVAELLVTDPLPAGPSPQAITFSGGVAEYLYGRERADYGDFGGALAESLRAALADGRIPLPLADPGQGIRATVIGASQFTVQVSGNTIFISDEELLPLHNLPVLYPRLSLEGEISAARVAQEIGSSIKRFDLVEGDDPVALAFRWQGDPLHARLRALTDGIHHAIPRTLERRLPVVLLFEGDVGKTIGAMLKQDIGIPNHVVSIDGMTLKEFDYVDIGEVIRPTNVVPVVIKSLLFAGTGRAS